MDQQYHSYLSQEERAANHARRVANRKRKKMLHRRKLLRQWSPVLGLAVVIAGIIIVWKAHPSTQAEAPLSSALSTAVTIPEPQPDPQPVPEPEPVLSCYAVSPTEQTIILGEEVCSSYAIVADLQSNTILAQKNSDTIINPASMTKILTLLVAVEHIENLEDSFTITREITDYCFVNDCSIVGLEVDETISIRELLYGCILPSGADACLALAEYTAGSHEAFVALMNEKLEELGLSETAHFTNCVGLYDENHFCSVYDMAMILKAAMDNALCREVLGARIYETLPTIQHPDGQILSNWFLRRIEDHDSGDIQVIAAKTGYVTKSGNCAASCGQDADGNLYICVTGNANSPWRAIYDHRDLYKAYCN